MKINRHYESIANAIGTRANAVHLVHFVMLQMKQCWVTPPTLNEQSEQFYTPTNICSAILAYLASEHKNPWKVLNDFDLSSSKEIGRIVKSLHDNSATRVVKKFKFAKKSYADIFDDKVGFYSLPKHPWIMRLQENAFPALDTSGILLKRHFCGQSLDSLVIKRRKFPGHIRADLQIAFDRIFQQHPDVKLYGLNPRNMHEGLHFRMLTEEGDHQAVRMGPLTYTEVSISETKTVNCLSNALWLGTNSGTPFAVVLGAPAAYSDSSQIDVEIALPETEQQQAFGQEFLGELERLVQASDCYRGKILSFEQSNDYRGYAAGIKVHELKHVSRDEVILPQETLDLLDRNIINFVQQRPELARRGMNLKKGLLLFGPPGTGKTHTVHYLSRALPDTTTLIITAEQVGMLATYMNLARLLQPSLVIIEDADLIARDRENMDTCEEVLLNKLLNEMDGLRADAEIIFILTTNRPEAIEAALVARPGRIDQAIEYPLPNDDGRRRLAILYAGSQTLSEEVIREVVKRTNQTSASFIKELMRRATQYAIARGENESIQPEDVDTAVQEMLFSGGVFNRLILGGNETQD